MRTRVALIAGLALCIAATAGCASGAANRARAAPVDISTVKRAFAADGVRLDIALDYRRSAPKLPQLADLRPVAQAIRARLEVVVYRTASQATRDAKRFDVPHPKGAPHTIVDRTENVLALLDSRSPARLEAHVARAMKRLRR